jgi:Cu(I)/Ag(I) efflux system membrane fusion protein
VTSQGKGALRGAVYGAVVLAAVGGVYVATSRGDAPAATPEAHVHGATAAGTDGPRPVSLTPAQQRRIGVTYAVATTSPFSREIRAVGQVAYDETRVRTIAPKVDGFVEQLLVDATGQLVSIGQPLLTIHSPMLVQVQEELLLAKRLERDMTGGDADARRSARELVVSARRRMQYWDISVGDIAEMERHGQVRRTMTLRSSANGYVLDKKVVAGQRVMAGDALYSVADLSVVWLEGDVFEQDLAGVRLGQAVEGEFQSLPGARRLGRISYISPTIDPQTRTVRIRIVLPNRDAVLKPGMYATLRIVGSGGTAVLSVPRGAVLSTGQRNMVFVREANGHLAAREVALGATNDDRVEIRSGLVAGETVVASATFLVDAESNLGTALGGMGNMPGMDVTLPPKALPARKE